MQCPKCNAHYHPDHGCGTSVMCGSSYAEHILSGCSVNPPLQGVRAVGGFFKPNNGHKYPIWECPASAGVCPWCWHKEHPEKENTALSDFGAECQTGMIKRGLI